MPNSAPSLRARHRDETTRALVRAARRMTAASGLSGFTLEQLCTEVGVSRRTFFNYFASKEDAVLCIPIERGEAEIEERFLAGGADAPGDGLTPTLLEDLTSLAEARWQALDSAPETFADLTAAVDREPRLIARMLQLVHEREKDDVRLIARREGLPEDHPLAVAAAELLATLSRSTADEFLQPGNTDPFPVVFARRMRAVRELFATQTAPEALSR